MISPDEAPEKPPLSETLSNEIAREVWCSRYWAENPVLSYRIVNMIWRQDIERVRALRKAIRLGLHRLIRRGYGVLQDQQDPAVISDTLANDVAHELWVAEYGQEHPELSYKEAQAVWATDVDRVRHIRSSTKLALVRLGRRGIVLSEPQ